MVILTVMDDLASIVEATHPPLTKPNDASHHCEAEYNTLEQGEDTDGVHVFTDQEIQDSSLVVSFTSLFQNFYLIQGQP